MTSLFAKERVNDQKKLRQFELQNFYLSRPI